MAEPEPKRWRGAALGGLLMAVAGLFFRAARKGGAMPRGEVRPAPERAGRGASRASGKSGGRPSRTGSRPKVGKAHVRTKPKMAEAPARTRHWPPPAPKPIEPSGDVHRAEEAARDPDLAVDRRSETLGYEVHDTRAGVLVKIMALGVSVIIVCVAGLFWLIGQSHRSDRESVPLTPQQLAVIVPPGPHLQDHPLHDIDMERQRESDLLTSYAWAAPDHRTARIPIARAEALVIGRPLDPLPDPTPAPVPQPSGPLP